MVAVGPIKLVGYERNVGDGIDEVLETAAEEVRGLAQLVGRVCERAAKVVLDAGGEASELAVEAADPA